MKIVVCAKRDLAGCLALNKLLAGFAGRHDVFVVLSDYVMEAEKRDPHAVFFVKHERNIVVDHVFPWLDEIFPDGSDAPFLTYAGLKAHYGVPIELWGPIRLPEVAAAMRDLAPDVIFSCRYDYVFRQNVIDMPPLGIYGLHPGALPRYQGLCCPFRALEQGDERSGCTVFHLDSGLDTGPIVDIGWNPVAYDRSVLWNFVHTYFAGVDALMRHFPDLERGRVLAAQPQPPDGHRYYSYPTDKEFRDFVQKGGCLVHPQDYLEMLSWFLPAGLKDARLPDLRDMLEQCDELIAPGI